MPDDVSHLHECVAMCSWSLRPSSPSELIKTLARTGIDALSLALSPLVHHPQHWGGALTDLTEAGVAVVSGMMATLDEDYASLQSIARTGGVRPDATWSANLKHAQAVADLAAAAGLPLVTFHAGFLPEDASDPERSKILDRIARIADIFADRGISLGLETGQETAATLLTALAQLNRPNLGVNFDPANMILYGMGDPVGALRLLSQHVLQVHIKDARASDSPGQWGVEVPAGEGEVHWPDFFEAARQLPRPVHFVIEREAGERRVEDIRIAHDLISRMNG